MLIVGIDENGLGPLIGPLVVTAAAFEAPEYDREAFWRIAKSHLPADDSKKIFSSGRLGKAERATLTWLDAFGHRPLTYTDLAAAICCRTPLPLPCGDAVPERCRPSSVGLPFFAKAPSEVNTIDADPLLSRNGIKTVAVRSVMVCPGAFNAALEDNEMNKLKLDFNLMMRLAGDLTLSCKGDAAVLCGKVGSTRKYAKWLEGAGFYAHVTSEENPQISSYEVAGIGRLSFIKDADALHLPVAVASMIGKYLRELAMSDLNRLLAGPGMRRASGYRDRVTADFVASTEKRRREIGLNEICFARKS
jgi:ribonuclease HII